MQCFPLYSILLALDNPTVDLLSLDIEGAELQGTKIVVVVNVDDVVTVVVVAVLVAAVVSMLMTVSIFQMLFSLLSFSC